MIYKPHVDGLRTLAVVPVVLFHLGAPALTGGFVGVDVFFVISGYLITGILYEDIENNRYSLSEFYKRRFLRILPALTAVMLACLAASTLVLLPVERNEFGRSASAASLFFSNIYFWYSAGYFDGAAETKPLLHTWSLSVEEQFYIFAPPLLYGCMKYAKRAMPIAVAATIALSLVACVLVTLRQPEAAFYLLPMRAWELGLGAGLAIWTKTGRLPSSHKGVISLLGVVLVAAPMLVLDEKSLFPGWNALPPCIGAVLLIGWGDEGAVGRLLSSRPMVSVGGLSYSLYLWHWPLIVFWRLAYGDSLASGEMLFLGLTALGLSALSTRFVERPFRSAAAKSLPPKIVIGGSATVIAGTAALGALVSSGLVGGISFPDTALRASALVNYRNTADYARQFRTGKCLVVRTRGGRTYDRETCANLQAGKINALVFGDSHAAQYWGAFQELYPNVNFLQATSSGCLPLIGAKGAPRCKDVRDWVFNDLLSTSEIDVVIIAARWTEDEEPLVRKTLGFLRTKTRKVMIIGPTVEYNGTLPLILGHSIARGESFDFASSLVPGKDAIDKKIEGDARDARISYISALKTECRQIELRCTLFASDGLPMQFDYGHLTLAGAKDVIRANRDEISRAGLFE